MLGAENPTQVTKALEEADQIKCLLCVINLGEVLLVSVLLPLRWASNTTRTMWDTCGPSKRRLITFDKRPR